MIMFWLDYNKFDQLPVIFFQYLNYKYYKYEIAKEIASNF